MPNEDAEGELQHGRQVLEQADDGERDPPGCGREEEQRYGGHDAGRYEQQVGADRDVAEGARSPQLDNDEVGKRGDRQHRRLDRETLDRWRVCEFLDQAIATEAGGQRQSDPWQPAVAQRDDDDGDDTQRDRNPLNAAQVFLEHDDAERDAHERSDEVTERRLEDVAGVDRPDVDAPVDADQQGGEREQADSSPIAAQREHESPPPADGEDARDEHQRPQHAVGQDLGGRCRFEQRPEQGEQSPDRVGGEAVPDALPRFARLHH